MLPELAEHQARVQEAGAFGFRFLEHHVYLVALLGLTTFYGLERLVLIDRGGRGGTAEKERTSSGVFWLHIASFSVYTALIGYLLVHREEAGLLSLLFFFVAMALHFLVNDFGLREHHKDAYARIGRWFLAAAVVIGWAIGLATEVQPLALAVLVAFIAGGTILNVLKEELPEERQSRFWAFALGALVYTVLVLGI